MEKMLPHSYKRSPNSKILVLFLLVLLFFTSCVTYTYEDAKEIIPPLPSDTSKAVPTVIKDTQQESISTWQMVYMDIPSDMNDEKRASLITLIDENKDSVIFIKGEQSDLDAIYEAFLQKNIVRKERVLIISPDTIHTYSHPSVMRSNGVSFAIEEGQADLLVIFEEESSSLSSSLSLSSIDVNELYQIEQSSVHLFASNLIPLDIQKVPSSILQEYIRGTFIIVE